MAVQILLAVFRSARSKPGTLDRSDRRLVTLPQGAGPTGSNTGGGPTGGSAGGCPTGGGTAGASTGDVCRSRRHYRA